MLPLATLPAPAALTCAVPGFAPFFAPLFLLIPLFWLIVIVLVVTLVGRRMRRGWDGAGPSWGAAHQAETVLSERYARGDIDEVEYRARLEVLRANQAAPRSR
jgi:putative membrane protein